jgi:oligosaccharide reducing-end xylanase
VSPKRQNWNFTGWNTARNGSGTPFVATTAVTANITVYAQWNEVDLSGFRTVTLNIVDKTEGDSVTLSPSSGKAGDTITITYTVADLNINNRLVFWGPTVAIDSADSAGSGTRTYAINEADVADGIITIKAVFTHTDLELDEIAFTSGVVNKTYGDDFFTNAMSKSGNGTGTISYSSGNTAVAMVDADGKVTIRGAGTAVITAVKEPDEEYEGTQADYTLHVAQRQLSIGNPNVTTTKKYDGTTTAAVITVGALTNKVGDDVVSVSATAAYNSANVAAENQITVVYSMSGTDAHNYIEPVNYTIDNGTITKADGRSVTVPAVDSAAYNRITVKAVTVSSPAYGQTAEYAISKTTTMPTDGWQTGTTFAGLDPETNYYIHARAAANTNCNAGAAQVSAVIKTPAKPAFDPDRATRVDFEADSVGKKYDFTRGDNDPTRVEVIADPAGTGKSLRVTTNAGGSNKGYNQAAIIPINLPYALSNYQSFSFRFYPVSGNSTGQIMVYAARSAGTFVRWGFGNASTAGNQFAANLVGQTPNISFTSTGNWIDYTITIDNPGAAISNLKGNIFIAIGINHDTALDYYVDDITFTLKDSFVPPPPLPKPQPPSTGAVASKNYRNLFKEWGKTDAEINAKIQTAWSRLFTGGDGGTYKIYNEVGSDMAYIHTVDTNDVRSEGMSYAMMIAVQMDDQVKFNRLWKWAKTYMYNTTSAGVNQRGYFAWQCGTDGSKKESSAAPDGEFYFVTSLLFASARWGDGEGIFEYRKHAMQLLYDMLHRFPGTQDSWEAKSMFNLTNNMPVFVPYGNSANHTDPSYHLPAFYEVWAIEMERDADNNKLHGVWDSVADLRTDAQFYRKAVQASRDFFPKTTNATTGLGPDYANFDGTPTGGNHADFRFDAWRIAMNIAMDYAWWAADSWQITFADRIQSFFQSKGVSSYGNQWTLSGNQLDKDHSPGLVACNAVASLAATQERAWEFLEDFWNISMTSGTYRYYDGCLYMLGLLHVTGNFKAYLSSNTVIISSSSISPTTATFDKKTGAQADIPVTITPNGNTFVRIQNGSNTLTSGTEYTVNGNIVTLKSSYLAAQPVGTTTLTFYFSAGANRSLAVTIADTTPSTNISPTTATFDKRADLQADIDVTMNLYGGNTFSNIQNNGTTLTSGTHYTVSSNTVTLKSSYLATLSVGSTTLTFNFSGGVSKTIVITIRQTAPGVTPGGTSFDFSTMTNVAVEYISPSGSTITATVQNSVLRVDKTGGYSSPVFILTFNLGDQNLSNFTGVKIKIRGAGGDTAGSKNLTVESVAANNSRTALTASTALSLSTGAWIERSIPFTASSQTLSTLTGEVRIAFGLNNTNPVNYEFELIELYK